MVVDVVSIRLDRRLGKRNDYIPHPALRLWPLPFSNTALWHLLRRYPHLVPFLDEALRPQDLRRFVFAVRTHITEPPKAFIRSER